METKTMKIQKNNWEDLDSLRGCNGCKTFDDVIALLINKFDEVRGKNE